MNNGNNKNISAINIIGTNGPSNINASNNTIYACHNTLQNGEASSNTMTNTTNTSNNAPLRLPIPTRSVRRLPAKLWQERPSPKKKIVKDKEANKSNACCCRHDELLFERVKDTNDPIAVLMNNNLNKPTSNVLSSIIHHYDPSSSFEASLFPSFNIYPDISRDIHQDFDLHLASNTKSNVDDKLYNSFIYDSWSTMPSLTPSHGDIESRDSSSKDIPSFSSGEITDDVSPPTSSCCLCGDIHSTDVCRDVSHITVDPAFYSGTNTNAWETDGQHLVLGEGRCGKVVLAVHRQTQIPVAVKIIEKHHLRGDLELNCRLELEIHKLLPRHPHIVALEDVYEDRRALYMVSELCDQRTLLDRILHDGQFSEGISKFLFIQLMSAVMHCHNHRIVHRDIKPENILFAYDPVCGVYDMPYMGYKKGLEGVFSGNNRCNMCQSHYVSYPETNNHAAGSCCCGSAFPPSLCIKVTDLGEACFAKEGQLLGTACGTVQYMAPEVLLGTYYDGYMSDMWSLGVVLYIMLSASPPFHGETHGQLVQKIISGSYDMKDYFWRSISEQGRDFLRGLLNVNPNERLSMNAALTHPWLVSVASIPTHSHALWCGYDEDDVDCCTSWGDTTFVGACSCTP